MGFAKRAGHEMTSFDAADEGDEGSDGEGEGAKRKIEAGAVEGTE